MRRSNGSFLISHFSQFQVEKVKESGFNRSGSDSKEKPDLFTFTHEMKVRESSGRRWSVTSKNTKPRKTTKKGHNTLGTINPKKGRRLVPMSERTPTCVMVVDDTVEDPLENR